VRGPNIDSDEVDRFHDATRIGPSLRIGRGRVQVRLALAFPLLAAVPGVAGGPGRMALFAALACLSLLLPELGQVLMGVASGRRVAVTLHALGVRTIAEPRLPRWQQFVATLTGPLISLALGSLFAWLHRLAPDHGWLVIAMRINLAWGAVNLLPVLPFAGGRALLTLVDGKYSSAVMLTSGALALMLAVDGLVILRSAPVLFIFGAAAFASLLRWSNQRRSDIERALGLPKQLETARSLLPDDPERAKHLAMDVARLSRSNLTANAAWEVVAWAELEQGCPESALFTLRRIRPASQVDVHCLASVVAARGQTRLAIGLLARAHRVQGLSVVALKLLIDLHAQLGAFDAACAVASAELAALDPDDVRRVIEAAFAANAIAAASKLSDELFALTGCIADAGSHAYGLVREPK
jgi:hypothetical protein